MPPLRSLWNKGWGNNNDPLPMDKQASIQFDNQTFDFSCLDLAGMELRWMFPMLNEQCKLLIRQEYVDAYDYLEQRSRSRSFPHGTIIIGQPGIGKWFQIDPDVIVSIGWLPGKSLFLLYIFIRRLREGGAVAIQIDQNQYRFYVDHISSQGEYALCTVNTGGLSSDTWVFSSSKVHADMPTHASFNGLAYAIQVVSPQSGSWRQWCQRYREMLYTMDTWSRVELCALAHILQVDRDVLLQHADRWGPSPRVPLLLTTRTLSEDALTRSVKTAARVFVYRAKFDLEALLESETYNSDQEFPSQLLFVRSGNKSAGEVDRQIMSPFIPTAHVASILADALRRTTSGNQYLFVDEVASDPHSHIISTVLNL